MRIARRTLRSPFRHGLVFLLVLAWADLLAGSVALALEFDDHAHATSLLRHDGHTHVVFAHEDESSAPAAREISVDGGDHVVDVASPGDAIRSKPRAFELSSQPLSTVVRSHEAPVRARRAVYLLQPRRDQPELMRTVVLRL